MGVPVDEIRAESTSPEARGFTAQFRARNDIDESVQLAVGVDRLDYTKGIVQRLRALEHLWESRPEWRGELTYVQNGSESRSRIPEYREVQRAITGTVERINDRFGTDDWTPVVYTTAHLSQAELYGLYRGADMAIVSPIRDGMNLVAQEYVAAQTDTDGVLVLSTTTGSYELLGDNALPVNPYDVEQFAETIHEGLRMSPHERRRRMDALRGTVAEHDLASWLDRALDVARPARPERI